VVDILTGNLVECYSVCGSDNKNYGMIEERNLTILPRLGLEQAGARRAIYGLSHVAANFVHRISPAADKTFNV